MRDYYADFLQNKNSVNTLPRPVSKVSKGQETKTKQPFDTFDTALPSVNQKIYAPKSNNENLALKTDYFHGVLNRFIADGITFDVSADDFQAIDPAQRLKISDKELLISDSNITAYELYRAAVMDVTRIWFENLLKNLFL